VILVQGVASIWLRGAHTLPVAQLHGLPKRIAAGLVAQSIYVDVENGVRWPVCGVAMGRGATENIFPSRENVVDLGPPLFKHYVVIGEGRLPGVPCEIGVHEGSRVKWTASFGPTSLEEWRLALRIRQFDRVAAGVVVFCARERQREERARLFGLRRS